MDISGVDTLTIEYFWDASASYTSGFAAIGEAKLYRDDWEPTKVAKKQTAFSDSGADTVELLALPIFKGDDWKLYDSVVDSVGTKHVNALGSTFFSDAERVYKLRGEYSRLQGTLFLRAECADAEWKTTLQIYGDGQLLFNTHIAGGDAPIPLDVDIAGVDTLTISYDWESSALYTNGFTAIGEAVLRR